ncbi:MAG: O-antigen ligase family protein [Lamprobacter sp.]|uniref:O-antigen ligase family protein n=1 Tax=Lamprobacter sp. TaxID=3100796 RepID=UPI002B25953D|nr:O-antigen ligase family protein [Lamprobacter sp.]MEA3638955.1 O-antigen ligase family protein [Lamprobacter sp.]
MTTAKTSNVTQALDALRLISLYGLSLSLFMAPAGISAGLALIWIWMLASLLALLLIRPLSPFSLPAHPLVWLILSFALYCLLQALFPRGLSAEPGQHWVVAFSWAQLAVVVPIAYALRGDERLLLRLFLLVLIGLLLGTLWRLDWGLLLSDAGAFFASRPGFGFPALAYALYAGTALIGLLALRHRCWYRRNGQRRWWALPLWLVAWALLAEGVVLTQARGSWLGLILVALLGAGLWLRAQRLQHGRIPRRPLLVAASGLLLLMALNAGKISERLNEEQAVAEQLLRGEVPTDQITSFTLRWHGQRFGLEAWLERPWLGWGPGASYSLMSASVAATAADNAAGAEIGVPALDAEADGASAVSEDLAQVARGIWHPEDGVLKHLHNSYLELLAQFGLVGFGLWMLIAILLLWAVYDAVRGKRLSQDLGLFLILALLYLAIWSLFNFRLVHQDFRGYWALLAGAALSMALYRREGMTG